MVKLNKKGEAEQDKNHHQKKQAQLTRRASC